MKNRLLLSEDSRNFWVNNLEAVEMFFMERVRDLNYPHKIPALSSNTTNKLSTLIRMEKKFVSTILAKVNQVLNSTSKRVVLLFDIDDTLGVSIAPEIEPTTFRPSAIPLLRLLNNYCVVGLLSNRLALSHGDLPEIFDVLDATMILSSRDASSKYSDEALKIREDLLSKEKLVLTDTSNLNKLVQLSVITRMHEDYHFIAIDDLPYAGEIGAHGIYVGQYLQCYL